MDLLTKLGKLKKEEEAIKEEIRKLELQQLEKIKEETEILYLGKYFRFDDNDYDFGFGYVKPTVILSTRRAKGIKVFFDDNEGVRIEDDYIDILGLEEITKEEYEDALNNCIEFIKNTL